MSSGGAVPPSSGWRDRAACRGIADPDVFFPVAETGPALAAQEAAAKTVCARCAVRVECLAFALAALPDGVAGGLTAAERRTHRSGDRAPAAQGLAVEGGGVWWPADHGSQREVTAAGRAAVRAGRPLRAVAREFGVSERTAHRWAAHVRAEQLRTGAQATA